MSPLSSKGVNEKRGQYSVNLTSEDRLLQKKNRAMNEPIFFYLHGTKIPQETRHQTRSARTPSADTSAIPKANAQPAASTSTSGN